MGPVGVKRHVYYVCLDGFLKLLLFLGHADHFNEALHAMGSLFIACDLKNVRPKTVKDLKALGETGALHQLLAEVIAILVYH